MKNIYLSFPSDIVFSLSGFEELALDETLLHAYIPGTSILNDSPRNIDMQIEFTRTKNKRLEVSKKRVVIGEDWHGSLPLDFYHLLYSIVRVKLLNRKLFPVHAALVNGILVVGHSGAGKTSVLLELVSKYGCKVFSGNKTIISFKNNLLEAVAGTKTITAHASYKKRYGKFSDRQKEYHDRIAFTVEEEKNTGIRAVAIVGLNDGVEENILLEKMSALHRLYPFFLDTVNADTIVNGGNDVFTGTPPEGTEKYLAQNLSDSLSIIPAYEIKGTLDFICHSLSKV